MMKEKKISYSKLWKLLIDKKMTRKDLRVITELSTATMAKLGRGDNINTDVLLRICRVLDCNIANIMEIEEQS